MGFRHSKFDWCVSLALDEPFSALPPKTYARPHPNRCFGENQLSPGSIGILPLTTDHLRFLQQSRVRASSCLSTSLTLSMVSSPGFGSIARYILSPFKTRFPYASTRLTGLSSRSVQLLDGSFFNRHGVTSRAAREKLVISN